MTRPTDVLMAAVADDMRPLCQRLREMGWDAGLLAEYVDNGRTMRMSVFVDLAYMPVPLEVSPETYRVTPDTIRAEVERGLPPG